MGEIVKRVRALAPGLFARRAAYLAQARDNVQWTEKR